MNADHIFTVLYTKNIYCVSHQLLFYVQFSEQCVLYYLSAVFTWAH